MISTDPQHSRATRKARGQFFTPQQVAVSLLRQVRSDLDLLGLPVPKRGPVLDPACGDGSFLSAALAEGWVESASDLFGFDIDGSVLAGPEGACLTRGDALLEDPVLLLLGTLPMVAVVSETSTWWICSVSGLGLRAGDSTKRGR